MFISHFSLKPTVLEPARYGAGSKLGLSQGRSGKLAAQAIPGDGLPKASMQHRLERPVLAGAPAISTELHRGPALHPTPPDAVPGSNDGSGGMKSGCRRKVFSGRCGFRKRSVVVDD
jgi:hypothetical protein